MGYGDSGSSRVSATEGCASGDQRGKSGQDDPIKALFKIMWNMRWVTLYTGIVT